MPEPIGWLEDRDDWHRWVTQQPLRPLLNSRYAKGRLECYYGLSVTLGQNPVIAPAIADERVTALGDRLCPGWHSALLCQYAPGVGILPHRDHTCFSAIAVMVNLGTAQFFEYPEREKRVMHLNDGAIVRLNTKILHGVEPVAQTRYSLTFRYLKATYLNLPLLEFVPDNDKQ
jgi:hypothetical protein